MTSSCSNPRSRFSAAIESMKSATAGFIRACVIRQAGGETARALHSGLPQSFFERCVFDEDMDIAIQQVRDFRLVRFDDDERHVRTLHRADDARADAASAADDEMIVEFAHLSLTAALVKGREHLRLNDCVDRARQNVNDSADPDDHEEAGEDAPCEILRSDIAVADRRHRLNRGVEAVEKRPAFEEMKAE